jgi:hypothetical protein
MRPIRTARDETVPVIRRPARAGHLRRRRSVGPSEEGQVGIEPVHERNRFAGGEARRTPGVDLPQVHDSRRHGFAEIEQRRHAIFLDRTIVADRRRAPGCFGELLRRSDERADDFPHASEIDTRQVRLDRRRPTARRPIAPIDRDSRIVAPRSSRSASAPEINTACGNTSMKARIIASVVVPGTWYAGSHWLT